MGMCKAGALGRGRWLWKGHLDVKWKQAYSESRAQQDAVKLTVRDNTSAQSQADFLCNVISLRSTQSVTDTYTASTCSKRVLHYIRLRNLGDVKHQIIHPVIDGDVMQYVIWAIEDIMLSITRTLDLSHLNDYSRIRNLAPRHFKNWFVVIFNIKGFAVFCLICE